MKKIDVSVVVPVYNVEKYVGKCLESLVNQTLLSLEIVVVNDGSTDHSQEIIDAYAAEYPDIIIPIVQENAGLGAARNTGIVKSRGEYIGFVDSDDWVDPKMFETMYHYGIREQHDIVLCDVTCINDGWDNGWHTSGYRGPMPPSGKVDYVKNAMNPAHAWNKLYRKSIFEIIKFYDGWYEDIATVPILISYANSIGYLPIQFYYYRQREQSIIQAKNDSRTLGVIGAWKQVLTLAKEEFQPYVIYGVYNSICEFISFKPEFADEFLLFAKENQSLFLLNPYIQEALKFQKMKNLFEMQLIPKKIHYFWFGNAPKSELILQCMDSWRKFAGDYEIIEWNESNCDINECEYVKEAYSHKKWAFVADYFRIKKVYEHGGFYLDTDMELTNRIDLLRQNQTFFEFETSDSVNACIFGSVQKAPIIGAWLDTYKHDHLVNDDGTLNTSYTIVVRLTKILKNSYKLKFNGKKQILKDDIAIHEPNVLILDAFDGKNIAIHHYDASWWNVKFGNLSFKNTVYLNYFTSREIPLQIEKMKKEVHLLKIEKQQQKLIIKQLNEEIQEKEQYKYHLDQILNSTSWKLTKPFRWFIDTLKKLIH